MTRLLRVASLALLVAVTAFGLTACASNNNSGGSSSSSPLPSPLDIELPTPDFDSLFG